MCSITESEFGRTPQGDLVHSFLLEHRSGLSARILNFGGILNELNVPCGNGETIDVVHGFNQISTYLNEDIYAGAVVGRIAGRLGEGTFTFDGKTYQLTQNEGWTHLHGGFIGFDKKLWNPKIVLKGDREVLELVLKSQDGEEGYPGNMETKVTYSLTDENGIRIEIEGKSDHSTPFCPTSHSYFNLSGNRSSNVLGHQLQLDSDRIAEIEADYLPTGNLIKTTKGINDFQKVGPVEQLVKSVANSHGAMYYLNQTRNVDRKVGILEDPNSGICMEILTDAPWLQVYTGSWLNTKDKGKAGVKYGPYSGICFECQGFPGAPKYPNLGSIWLHPGSTFGQFMEYRFKMRV